MQSNLWSVADWEFVRQSPKTTGGLNLQAGFHTLTDWSFKAAVRLIDKSVCFKRVWFHQSSVKLSVTQWKLKPDSNADDSQQGFESKTQQNNHLQIVSHGLHQDREPHFHLWNFSALLLFYWKHHTRRHYWWSCRFSLGSWLFNFINWVPLCCIRHDNVS